MHAAAVYLAHMVRALTMTEAQIDRLPQVDDGLRYMADRRRERNP